MIGGKFVYAPSQYIPYFFNYVERSDKCENNITYPIQPPNFWSNIIAIELNTITKLTKIVMANVHANTLKINFSLLSHHQSSLTWLCSIAHRSNL